MAAYVTAGYDDEQVNELVRLGLECGTLRRDTEGRIVTTLYTPRWQHLLQRVAERAGGVNAPA